MKLPNLGYASANLYYIRPRISLTVPLYKYSWKPAFIARFFSYFREKRFQSALFKQVHFCDTFTKKSSL